MSDTSVLVQKLASVTGRVAAQLAGLGLPSVSCVEAEVTRWGGDGRVRAQLPRGSTAELAAGLVSWAAAVGAVTVQVWRVLEGSQLLVSVEGRLPGEGVVVVQAYGSMEYDPVLVGDVSLGESCVCPVGELGRWAEAGRSAEG